MECREFQTLTTAMVSSQAVWTPVALDSSLHSRALQVTVIVLAFKSDHARPLPKPIEGWSCQSTGLYCLRGRTSHRPPLCSLSLSATASTLALCPALPLPACTLVIGALTISIAWTWVRGSSWCVLRPGQAISGTLLASLSPIYLHLTSGVPFAFCLSTPRGGDAWLCLSAWLVLLENNSPEGHWELLGILSSKPKIIICCLVERKGIPLFVCLFGNASLCFAEGFKAAYKALSKMT
jgi:hypothetical protein